jgi:hypothetical protein
MLFPLSSNAVQLTTEAIAGGDVYSAALRMTNEAAPKVRASTGAVATYNAGVGFTIDGQLCYFDATAGLPVDTVWANGLPTSAGKLCVSTNAANTWAGMIPFAANGAVCVVITP